MSQSHAKRHQLLHPSAVHGITKFSNLTMSEFWRNHLGLKKALILPPKDLPIDYDWRDHGALTYVKDQDSCGSFSTTEMLEGAYFLATGELVSLSEQQLVDCDHEDDLRVQLEMDPELPAVLLMGGGEGMGHMKKTSKALGESLLLLL